MLNRAKQINEFVQKQKQIQSQLDAEVIEVSYKGVSVTITANRELKGLETNGQSDDKILTAINRAIKEAEKIATKKARGSLQDMGLNIPGL